MRDGLFVSLMISLLLLCSFVVSRANASSVYTDRALRLLMEYDRDVTPSLRYILQLSNRYQVHVIQALLSHSTQNQENYQIANKFPALLKVDNVHAARAIKAMVSDGRDIRPSLDYLVKINNPLQVQALKILLEGRTWQQETYGISNKMQMILAIENPTQLKALRLLVDGGVGVVPSASLDQVAAIKAEIERRPYIFYLARYMKSFGVVHPVFRPKNFSTILNCGAALDEPSTLVN